MKFRAVQMLPGAGAASLMAVLTGLLSGCGPDLGACPAPAVYDAEVAANTYMVHPGQALIDERCAGGRCHSASAVGDIRVGAPAELNFDTMNFTPNDPAAQAVVAAGAANSASWADHMWGEIEAGAMPPEGQATALTDAEKEAIRGFLACGAPVRTPMMAPPANGGADPLEQAFTALTGPVGGCLTCHSPTAAAAAGAGYVLANDNTDLCSFYDNAINTVPVCDSTRQMVVPGMPDLSVLVGKLDGTNLCGNSLMPLDGRTMPFSQDQPAVVEALRTWVANGASKPATCP